jgi:hypothetical protein
MWQRLTTCRTLGDFSTCANRSRNCGSPNIRKTHLARDVRPAVRLLHFRTGAFRHFRGVCWKRLHFRVGHIGGQRGIPISPGTQREKRAIALPIDAKPYVLRGL